MPENTFIKEEEVYFSELSPRPHDTGMVTMFTQNFSEFDLHSRAILGFTIPKIEIYKKGVSQVILATKNAQGKFLIKINPLRNILRHLLTSQFPMKKVSSKMVLYSLFFSIFT